MKNKRAFKIILDVIMLVLLVLMFKKNAISMSFHEIGGLALIGLFVIHNIVNGKWIKSIYGRFFTSGVGLRTRIAATVNFLSAVVFILIGVSGVLMTHGGSGEWRTIHYFCAALSIILMGIHLGLHWYYIRNAFGKIRFKKTAKAVGTVFIAAAVAYGVYSTASSSFIKWIEMPFSVSSESGNMYGQESDENTGNNVTDSITSATTAEGDSAVREGGKGLRGNEGGTHQNGGGQISASNIFSTIASFLSIIIMFAFITVLISNLSKGKRIKAVNNKSEFIAGECREL